MYMFCCKISIAQNCSVTNNFFTQDSRKELTRDCSGAECCAKYVSKHAHKFQAWVFKTHLTICFGVVSLESQSWEQQGSFAGSIDCQPFDDPSEVRQKIPTF